MGQRMTPAEQWDKTARMYWRAERECYIDPASVVLWSGLGRVVRRHRFANVGDILIPSLTNGADRWGFTGVTSKGYRLNGFYFTVRPRKKGGMVQLVELPGELVETSPLHPGVRAFVLDSLRAGDVPEAIAPGHPVGRRE